MTRNLATLTDALDWASSHWEGRPVPTRLHTRQEDGIGLGFTPAFERRLDAHPGQVTQEERSVVCGHPTLPPRVDIRECHECAGSGWKQAMKVVYRYPMWRAFSRLANAPNTRRAPHPTVAILCLASVGWDAEDAMLALDLPSWDYAEAYFLSAIRQLHGRFEEGPIETRRSTWTLLSESQQNAIIAGETAA